MNRIAAIAGLLAAFSPTPGNSDGTSIVVCGKKVDVGTRVVLWSDPGGYDAYSLKPPLPDKKGGEKKERKRYDFRKSGQSDIALAALREVVDQFVLHYDVAGTSKYCFKVLQDARGLSVHFMLDLDGTIYQTLDLREKAWHATIANGRSVGVEIAHIGAYPANKPLEGSKLAEWYHKDAKGMFVVVPKRIAPESWKIPDFTPRPRKEEPIVGEVQNQKLRMYDYTPEQYAALIKLTAGLCKTFPKIKCDYPRDEHGRLINHKLPDGQLVRYGGVLGHYHVQTNKTDPGPALDWDYLIDNAKKQMSKVAELK